ncbi:non-ribosomal peptide synthetase family protein [Williamsia sterculiae]|uniref:Amino acid adenylation domain-containing protein n=1 Tax=Williamsia sterculiae TaxID=1344003 RepID=A0A1N7EKB8_9NOCA|nr:amino acid adenylation domain-containing protein [Williamsia sterculiae]SIR88459.1 amino acid adenylation domain-containing protein [Williamsia sterculiae]
MTVDRPRVTSGETLSALFDAQVASAPDATACVSGPVSVNYRGLSRRVDTIAAELQAIGVGRGDTVAVFCSPSIDVVAAVWAILRTGAGYLPLATDYPAERLAHMVGDSEVRTVVVDTDTEDRARRMLPATATTLLVDGTQTVGGAETGNRVAPVTGDDTAYTIYTSGTTGLPKGVMVPHAAIVNQLRWLRDQLGLASGSRILLKTPIGFDAAQWELLANACGATVVVAPVGTSTRPSEILDTVARHSITILQCVPTVWRELVASPDIERARDLQVAVSGGEPLPESLGTRMQTVLRGARMINLYGPTETTINATWFDFTDVDLTGTAVVPVGTPVTGCATVVVDASDTVVGPGSTGELLISGAQLASGYRGRVDVTAARFPSLDVGDGETRRFYRTGDLVRRRRDGVLEFVGRNDEQVKINGHRVETNEVRIRIETHDWVRAAAVVPWVNEQGTTQLAGFVELDPDEAPLMDSDVAGRHHRSKSTRTQVAAQLQNLAARRFDDAVQVVSLPGGAGDPEQFREVFARKTYRHFTDETVDILTVCDLLDRASGQRVPPVDATPISLASIGRLLRWFGPFESAERLLPKYAYASPGALNATRIYIETSGAPGLDAGVHYFDPVNHTLTRVGAARRQGLHLHLVGVPAVIESVYATNVREVLHVEAGHMLGVLDRVTARWGWRPVTVDPATDLQDVADGGVATASVRVESDATGAEVGGRRPSVYLQTHDSVSGAGLYRHTGRGLEFVTASRIERRHVVAINQRTFAQSSFGLMLALGADSGWSGFVELGRFLAHVQQEGVALNIGLMSAGYSSLSGRDLPSASRFREMGGVESDGLSYFAVGGHVSDTQIVSTGMDEDIVHMDGPEELLKESLREVLPSAMVPTTIHVMDRIPQSHHGKQDRPGLVRLAGDLNRRTRRVADPPVGPHESRLADVWARVLDYRPVYRSDDFFAQGGNSMSALRLIRAVHDELGVTMPVQTIFTAPTVAQLSTQISTRVARSEEVPVAPVGRVHRLAGTGTRGTTLLWPGLGGYPMSLRTLAGELAQNGHTVYGVQARGLNAGELPPGSLVDLIDDDVQAVRDLDLPEPLRVVGYSFGARVAVEVASRLVDAGHAVERVVLIAPGSPVIGGLTDRTDEARYDNRYFTRILASVFTGRTDPPFAADLDSVGHREDFVDLVVRHQTAFGREMVERIVTVVENTFRMREEPVGVEPEFLDRSLYLRARGDGPSFADLPVAPLHSRPGRVSNLPYRHYDIIVDGALDIASAVLEQTVEGELV